MASTKSDHDPSQDSGPTQLQKALERSQVHAQVIACDHFRIRGGLAVETDYIVLVYPTEKDLFSSFALSKTYSAFRSFAQQLDEVYNEHEKEAETSAPTSRILKYCRLVSQLIDSQRTRYLGKVNYLYVKVLAQERRRILDSVLDATIRDFPTHDTIRKLEVVRKVALIMQTFFLTDHCVVDAETLLRSEADIPDEIRRTGGRMSKDKQSTSKDDATTESPLGWIEDGIKMLSEHLPKIDGDGESLAPPSLASIALVPVSYRHRRSIEQRELDEVELAKVAGEEARLLLDDDRPANELVPSYSTPVPVIRAHAKWGKLVDNNPIAFLIIAAIAVRILSRAAQVQVHLDGDVCLLLIFASFCVGLHTPRPLIGGFDSPPTMVGAVVQHDKSGRELLSRSMSQQMSPLQADDGATEPKNLKATEPTASSTTPMTKLAADDPPIGSYVNCWSDPDPKDFSVRGPNYLVDHKKIPSGNFLFPSRGIELLLTDACPEHVAGNPRLFGGKLRDVPTFIINFRLPWGVLLFYFEIPKRFLPFVRAGYEAVSEEELGKLNDGLEQMSPSERTLGRFLMNDQSHKNKNMKILPVVIDGPWVVRRVVGGKPAIIGNKMAVNYHYGAGTDRKSPYLEADLDIAASAAARGILSVARSYTQVLTLNLGFVVQGNGTDELPEEMLVGIRLHGIDPLSAPPFPSLMPHNDNDALLNQDSADDNDSVTPVKQ